MSKSRRNKRNSCDVGISRSERGEQMIAHDRQVNSQDYNLSWFQPTQNQRKILESIKYNDCTVVQASSGVGKSTSAIYQALKMLQTKDYNKIIFIKTPSEDSNDKIGFLTGSSNQKLEAHMEAMRSIFHSFMSANKLEMEERRGNIVFTIPNFIAGLSWGAGTVIIVDEAQKISDNIMKLIMERVCDGAKLIVLGDKYQRYAHDKRNDGMSVLVDMITELDCNGERHSKEEPIFGYVELTSEDNMRGRLSKRVLELFEGHFNKVNKW